MDPVRTARGVGRAKLLLFGEHSAVYGSPASGISLPLTTEIRLTETRHRTYRLYGVDREDIPEFNRLITFIDDQIDSGEIDLPYPSDCDIELSSAVPKSRGLGSSAALSAALAQSLLKLHASSKGCYEIEQDETHRLLETSNHIERFFHGTPSGIDTRLALGSGVLALYPNPPGIPVAHELSGPILTLVVGSTKREGSTKSLVASIRARMQNTDRETTASIDALGALAAESIELLSSSATTPKEIGATANRAQKHLRALGLSTPTIDTLLETGLSAGAAGGKLSGAGGGGAFYLVARDRKQALICRDRLREKISDEAVGVCVISKGAVQWIE